LREKVWLTQSIAFDWPAQTHTSPKTTLLICAGLAAAVQPVHTAETV
jgi:hypothetical protein